MINAVLPRGIHPVISELVSNLQMNNRIHYNSDVMFRVKPDTKNHHNAIPGHTVTIIKGGSYRIVLHAPNKGGIVLWVIQKRLPPTDFNPDFTWEELEEGCIDDSTLMSTLANKLISLFARKKDLVFLHATPVTNQAVTGLEWGNVLKFGANAGSYNLTFTSGVSLVVQHTQVIQGTPQLGGIALFDAKNRVWFVDNKFCALRCIGLKKEVCHEGSI